MLLEKNLGTELGAARATGKETKRGGFNLTRSMILTTTKPSPFPRDGQIHSLTGLRIFAAIWVVLYHFREVFPNQTWEYPLVDWLFRYGGHGVTLFFVLSGYILSHVYAEKFRARVTIPAFWSFMLFRIARLYPVHLVTLTMMVALFAADTALGGRGRDDNRFDTGAIVASLTMTQAWIPGLETPNSPSWSISAEWFAYLLFPLLCFLAARVRWSSLVLAILGLTLAIILETELETHLLHIMSCFLVGMAAHKTSRQIRAPLPKWMGTGAVLVILAVQAIPFETSIFIQILLFATLIMSLGAGTDLLCKPLSKAFMVYLGELSYAIYMFHWVARVVVRAGAEKFGIHESLHPAAFVAAYSIVTFIGAVVLFRYVEKPGRQWIRKLEAGAGAKAVSTLSSSTTKSSV